jgi:hypothetical protein
MSADPQRQCRACRRVRSQSELLRFVCGPEGRAALDARGKLPGRGAYLCPRPACIRQGFKPKGLGRALGCATDHWDAAGLGEEARQATERQLLELLGHAHRAGKVVWGADRVSRALEAGEADWAWVARDASDRLASEIEARVPTVRALDKEQIGHALDRGEVGVLLVTEAGLGDRIRILAGRWNGLKEES